MRVKCKCGNIAGWWYSPMIFMRMRVDQYLNAHCFCASCADLSCPWEYEYVGFHKKDWRWLKLKGLKGVEYNVNVRDSWMDEPYYMVSYIRDGKKWYYGIARSMEEIEKLQGVEWKENWYPDIRGVDRELL